MDGRDVIIDKRTEAAPWYVEADLNYYIENNKRAYYEAVELAARVQDFIDYTGPDRTAYAERYALGLGLGVSLPTLYRYVDNVLKASAWALKLEREDGQSRDYFRALSLCRKPREKATFPSLTDEQRAVIENIWFDRRFAANLGTVEMLYEKFEEIAEDRSWPTRRRSPLRMTISMSPTGLTLWTGGSPRKRTFATTAWPLFTAPTRHLQLRF